MANDRKNIKFLSHISEYNNCVCDACFGISQVIKLEVPVTKYHDGKNLTTSYHPYWLCRECRDKLVKTLDWIDWRADDGN